MMLRMIIIGLVAVSTICFAPCPASARGGPLHILIKRDQINLPTERQKDAFAATRYRDHRESPIR